MAVKLSKLQAVGLQAVQQRRQQLQAALAEADRAYGEAMAELGLDPNGQYRLAPDGTVVEVGLRAVPAAGDAEAAS